LGQAKRRRFGLDTRNQSDANTCFQSRAIARDGARDSGLRRLVVDYECGLERAHDREPERYLDGD
jgi:hypothetical protein